MKRIFLSLILCLPPALADQGARTVVASVRDVNQTIERIDLEGCTFEYNISCSEYRVLAYRRGSDVPVIHKLSQGTVQIVDQLKFEPSKGSVALENYRNPQPCRMRAWPWSPVLYLARTTYSANAGSIFKREFEPTLGDESCYQQTIVRPSTPEALEQARQLKTVLTVLGNELTTRGAGR